MNATDLLQSPDAVLLVVLSISLSLSVVFMRRLLKKIDNMATELYSPRNGVLLRVDRLERILERRQDFLTRPTPIGEYQR